MARIIAVIVIAFLSGACGGSSGGSSSSPAADPTGFGNPEPVTITGYAGDAMEPFISRDGACLFFNSHGGPSNKDLFHATFLNETTFQLQGPLTSINTPAVDGVATMDRGNRFYFVSTVNYRPPAAYDTLYTGTWDGNTVTGVTPVTGLAITIPGFVNFDVEVSPDGSTLYFNDGDFRGGRNFPDAANISIAVDSGAGFVRDPDSSSIMANINTANLEYAPAISADGLEIFFTRLDVTTMETRIWQSTRPHASAPFGPPQPIAAISGFVEGPSLSPDEKSLYYHRRNISTGRFEIYRVRRH